MIDLRKNETGLKHNIDRARERNIILPTLEQQRDPSKIPEKIKEKLTKVGMQDINPLNLFRITWKNEQKDFGGLYHGPNYIVLPPELRLLSLSKGLSKHQRVCQNTDSCTPFI